VAIIGARSLRVGGADMRHIAWNGDVAYCKGRVSNADPTFVEEVADRERQFLADHFGIFTNLVCARAACAVALAR
jgi:hypothetical protein